MDRQEEFRSFIEEGGKREIERERRKTQITIYEYQNQTKKKIKPRKTLFRANWWKQNHEAIKKNNITI